MLCWCLPPKLVLLQINADATNAVLRSIMPVAADTVVLCSTAISNGLPNLVQALVMLHLTGSCYEIDMVLPYCHSCNIGQYSVCGPWKKQSCKHEDIRYNHDMAIWLQTGLAISTYRS